jgi:hypothetical protein
MATSVLIALVAFFVGVGAGMGGPRVMRVLRSKTKQVEQTGRVEQVPEAPIDSSLPHIRALQEKYLMDPSPALKAEITHLKANYKHQNHKSAKGTP